MLCKWKYRSEKNVGEETFATLPSLRYENPESPDIVVFVCVCELQAVLARIPLGPTERLGPGSSGRRRPPQGQFGRSRH